MLRVWARITGDPSDIALPETKKQVEKEFSGVIRDYAGEGGSPGTFNQALMELGAIVCVPNGAPLCRECPAAGICTALRQDRIGSLPVKSGKKPRRIEEKTVLILQNGQEYAIHKRSAGGLLGGLYELPNLEGLTAG